MLFDDICSIEPTLISPSEDVSAPVIFSQQFASSVLQLKELPLSFTLCHHEKMYICREDR